MLKNVHKKNILQIKKNNVYPTYGNICFIMLLPTAQLISLFLPNLTANKQTVKQNQSGLNNALLNRKCIYCNQSAIKAVT